MRNNHIAKRMKFMSGFMLGMIAFLIAMPFSATAASAFLVGFTAMPFLPMPSMSFATTGTGGDDEAAKAKKALFDEIKTIIGVDVAKFLKENPELESLRAFKAEMDNAKAKIDAQMTPEQIKTLKEELNQALLDIKALKEKKIEVKSKIESPIMEMILGAKEKITSFVKKGEKSLVIEQKANETSTDIDGRDAYFTWHEGGAVGQIPVRKPFVRELFTNRTVGTEQIKYIDQETVVRNASNVALCGTTTSNTKATWKVRGINVEKVRDFGTFCLDMMDDFAFVNGEIRNLFNSSLQLKIDNNFLLANGTSPNPYSVDSVASTFAAANVDPTADYAGVVPYANMIDLISVAAAQIKAFGQNNAWMPNYVLMNPRDVQVMKYIKDSQKNYIRNNQLFQSFFTEGGMGRYFVDGVEIIENPLVPQNEFYIGDFRKGTVYNRPGAGIEFAYENSTNFEQELVTIKVYERLNLLIRNVDANAFMHCADIEQGIFDISVPT